MLDRRLAVSGQRRLEHRRPEPVEKQFGEAVETRPLGDGEKDEQALARNGPAFDIFLKRGVELGQRMSVERLLLQLDHGLHGRRDAVTSRFGEERGVIPLALIGIAAREIDDVRTAPGEQVRIGEIVADAHHLVRRLELFKVARRFDEDEPVAHWGKLSSFVRRRSIRTPSAPSL